MTEHSFDRRKIMFGAAAALATTTAFAKQADPVMTPTPPRMNRSTMNGILDSTSRVLQYVLDNGASAVLPPEYLDIVFQNQSKVSEQLESIGHFAKFDMLQPGDVPEPNTANLMAVLDQISPYTAIEQTSLGILAMDVMNASVGQESSMIANARELGGFVNVAALVSSALLDRKLSNVLPDKRTVRFYSNSTHRNWDGCWYGQQAYWATGFALRVMMSGPAEYVTIGGVTSAAVGAGALSVAVVGPEVFAGIGLAWMATGLVLKAFC